MATFFSNEFHGTGACTEKGPGDILDPTQVAIIRRELCPIRDCACVVDALGQRGPERWPIEERADGSVVILPTERGA